MTIKGTITRVLLFFILLLPLAQLFSMGTVVSRVWGIPLNIAPTVSFILCLCVCVCVCVCYSANGFKFFTFLVFSFPFFHFGVPPCIILYFICILEPSVSLWLTPPLDKGGKPIVLILTLFFNVGKFLILYLGSLI